MEFPHINNTLVISTIVIGIINYEIKQKMAQSKGKSRIKKFYNENMIKFVCLLKDKKCSKYFRYIYIYDFLHIYMYVN